MNRGIGSVGRNPNFVKAAGIGFNLAVRVEVVKQAALFSPEHGPLQ